MWTERKHPRILRAAGVEGVTFRELDPCGFDTLVFPDFTFRVPKGLDTYRARLIAIAERVFPGLEKDIVFQEVSTPLTHTRYTQSTGGTAYGIALIPSQFLFRRPGPATEIPGLYLCGASTYTGHGIPGVMWSGVLVASRVVGGRVLSEVMGKNRHS